MFSCSQLNERGEVKRIIGGSSGAGVSFVGLSALVLQCADFDEIVAMAERGQHEDVDLFVRDVAGGSYAGVPDHYMASSFGRVAKAAALDPCAGLPPYHHPCVHVFMQSLPCRHSVRARQRCVQSRAIHGRTTRHADLPQRQES